MLQRARESRKTLFNNNENGRHYRREVSQIDLIEAKENTSKTNRVKPEIAWRENGQPRQNLSITTDFKQPRDSFMRKGSQNITQARSTENINKISPNNSPKISPNNSPKISPNNSPRLSPHRSHRFRSNSEFAVPQRNTSLERFIAAEVSPIVNRKAYRKTDSPRLPRVLQLKLTERRRSRSVHDLNAKQPTEFEKALSSMVREHESWSVHWKQARKGTVQRESLPSIDCRDCKTVSGWESQESSEEDSSKEEDELDLLELSLEDRLALIERKQGIKH